MFKSLIQNLDMIAPRNGQMVHGVID